MKNQERLLAYFRTYLSEKGLDPEEFEKQWNSSAYSRQFSFFGIANITITHNTWQEAKRVSSEKQLKVLKRDRELAIHSSLHGCFDYVPEWTTGDGNYYFFNFDSAGTCRKLRIYIPPDLKEPMCGEIKTCLHSVSKDSLVGYTHDDLDFNIESTFHVQSVEYGAAATIDASGCLVVE